jgi:hypothetical protein
VTATEGAFEGIRRMNRLLTKIDEKFEVLDIVCMEPKEEVRMRNNK